MSVQAQINFNRIANAIDFIKNNFVEQPTLDEIAAHVNMSSFHFQKMFTEWAGVSPKKFLQFITISRAKNLLKEKQITLFDTAEEVGLSSTSRLHDMFVHIEGITPAEYKNEGQNTIINYSFVDTIFGKIIIASTPKGVCHIAFVDEEKIAIDFLQKQFYKSILTFKKEKAHGLVANFFNQTINFKDRIHLHLKGTAFQLKVWETLLSIPSGNLTTYGTIATKIKNPKASRAVGTAIGDNPIAYLIPCHRVIQSSGVFGGYMWGPKRKTAIIGWEGVKAELFFET
jgi:AraC family transcriptional regulator, regulatory protein of adaptative response / methylated-DNA-[protein]-cysteine methyltransferase